MFEILWTTKIVFSERYIWEKAKQANQKTLTFDTFEKRGLLIKTVLLQPPSWTQEVFLAKNKKQQQNNKNKREKNNKTIRNWDSKRGGLRKGLGKKGDKKDT